MGPHCYTKLWNTPVNDCDVKKSVRCSWVVVITELVVSGTKRKIFRTLRTNEILFRIPDLIVNLLTWKWMIGKQCAVKPCDYCPQTKLREVNVFTSMCLSFCSRGDWSLPLPSMHHSSQYQGFCLLGVCIKADPSPSPPGYGQQAGGTHPTGMHSCYKQNLLDIDQT